MIRIASGTVYQWQCSKLPFEWSELPENDKLVDSFSSYRGILHAVLKMKERQVVRRSL